MSLNFPIPNTIGQPYTDQNGVVWVAESVPPAAVKWIREGAVAAYVEEAPIDSKQYVREDADWAEITIPAVVDPIPTGTIMLFYQAAIPVGWEKLTTRNDYMLRMVSGNAGGSGGSHSPIKMDKVPIHSHSGSSDETANHRHAAATSSKGFCTGDLVAGTNGNGSPNGSRNPDIDQNNDQYTGYAGKHKHTISVGDNSGSNWLPKYINIMQCKKL